MLNIRTPLSSLFFLLVMVAFSCKKKDETKSGLMNHNLAVGSTAKDLLSSANYNHLKVEIQYVRGYAPTEKAVNNLRSFLETRLNKPKGISFHYSVINTPNKQFYSAADIAEVEKNHRTTYSRRDTLGIYFFFADGDYAGNSGSSKVLGIAYKNTSMALFQKTIHEYTDEINEADRSTLETIVLNHEMGHILGLVNTGSAMQSPHQDDAHGHHCNNENCLMYYTAETGSMVSKLLLGGSIPVLDQNCIRDLQANGGK